MFGINFGGFGKKVANTIEGGAKVTVLTAAMIAAIEQDASAFGNIDSNKPLQEQAKEAAHDLDSAGKKNVVNVAPDGTKRMFKVSGSEQILTVVSGKDSRSYVDVNADGGVDEIRFTEGGINLNHPDYQPGGKNYKQAVDAQINYTGGLLVLDAEAFKAEQAAAAAATASNESEVK